MFEAYLCFWKNYFNFSGRARRSEYWFAYIVSFIVAFLLVNLAKLLLAFSEAAGSFMLFVYSLYLLALIIPSISVSVRRLHDTGRSGVYIIFCLMPIIGIVLLLLDSQPGTNRYGVSTKYPDEDIDQQNDLQ